MKQGYTDITVVLDKSGSMSSISSDTIGGYNEFINKQKEVTGTATVTLAQFDNEYKLNYTAMDINDIPKLTSNSYVPRGETALLDAIGRSINETGKRLANMNESDRPEKVVFVVITDGFENSSKEFNKFNIANSIKHQTNKYSWLFVYLGANQDAITVGSDYGFTANNSLSFSASSIGCSNVFAATANNLNLYRSNITQDMAYSATDRTLSMGE